MTVRTGMVAVVKRLRQMTSAATDDIFEGVTYWSDDQLQDILDSHKRVAHYLLYPDPYVSTDGQEYNTLRWTPVNERELYEETLTQVWQVDGSAELIASADVSVDYDSHLVSYLDATYADTLGTEQHEISLVAYDMNGAAADVVEAMIMQRRSYVRTKAGAHTLDLQQEVLTLERMLHRFRGRKIKAFKWPRPQRYRTSWTILGKRR